MSLLVCSISRNITASFISMLFISRPQKLLQTCITSVFATAFKRGKSVRWLWCRWPNWCKECSRTWIYELQSHLWWQHGHKDLLQLTQSKCGKAWHKISSNLFVLVWPIWAGFHYTAFLISLSLKYWSRSGNEIFMKYKVFFSTPYLKDG